MNDNVSVEGEIQGGFTQYGVPKQTSEDENGEIKTDFWPKHINPDELAKKQRAVLEVALQNPTLGTEAVEERADVSSGYASMVLREKVPDWYENQFKNNQAQKSTEWVEKDDDKRVDQYDSQEQETRETDVQEILGVLKATAVHQETKQALNVLEGYL